MKMTYSFTNSKGTTYYLHAKKSTHPSDTIVSRFYFSQKIGEEAVDDLPEGYVVVEKPSGLPALQSQVGDPVHRGSGFEPSDFNDYIALGSGSGYANKMKLDVASDGGNYDENAKTIKRPHSKPGTSFIALPRPKSARLAGDETTDAPPARCQQEEKVKKEMIQRNTPNAQGE
jgi:hypothetical protein